MKIWLILIQFVCFLTLTFSQNGISSGVFIRNDHLFLKKNSPSAKQLKAEGTSKIYPGYFISFDKQKVGILYEVNLQFHQRSLNVSSTQNYSYYWNHGEFSESYRKLLSADLLYGYLGMGFSLNKVIFENDRNKLYAGFFLHFDRLLFHKESNHRDSTIERQSGVGFSFELNKKLYWTETTYHPPKQEPFNLIDMNKNCFSIGTNLGHCIFVKQFFFKTNLRLGLNLFRSRFHIAQFSPDYEVSSPTNYQNTHFFYQLNTSIGYTW